MRKFNGVTFYAANSFTNVSIDKNLSVASPHLSSIMLPVPTLMIIIIAPSKLHAIHNSYSNDGFNDSSITEE